MQRANGGVILLCMLLMFAVRIVPAAEVLTNDSIVTMVKAGLGEELILGKIKISQGQYDVSTDGLVKLKKDGVSEKIIQAMMAAGSTAPMPPEPMAGPPAAVPPSVAQIDVLTANVVRGQSLFVKKDDKIFEVLPVIAEVVHSMAKHFIPFYFGPGDNWHFIRGEKSAVSVAKGKPAFYTKVNPSSFLLARLSYDPARNIRYVVSTGATYRDTIPIVVNRLSDGLFELLPGRDLGIGEYAFVGDGAFFYDFGIE